MSENLDQKILREKGWVSVGSYSFTFTYKTILISDTSPVAPGGILNNVQGIY